MLLISILLLASILRLIAPRNWGNSLYADFLLWDEQDLQRLGTEGGPRGDLPLSRG